MLSFAIIVIILVSIQLCFAFACVNEAKRKGRLNNWWVLAAAIVPIIPFLIMQRLPPKNESMETK